MAGPFTGGGGWERGCNLGFGWLRLVRRTLCHHYNKSITSKVNLCSFIFVWTICQRSVNFKYWQLISYKLCPSF